jgi:hypothetical protein
MAAGSLFDKPALLRCIIKRTSGIFTPTHWPRKIEVSIRDELSISIQAVRLSESVYSKGPHPFTFGTSILSQGSNAYFHCNKKEVLGIFEHFN